MLTLSYLRFWITHKHDLASSLFFFFYLLTSVLALAFENGMGGGNIGKIKLGGQSEMYVILLASSVKSFVKFQLWLKPSLLHATGECPAGHKSSHNYGRLKTLYRSRRFPSSTGKQNAVFEHC